MALPFLYLLAVMNHTTTQSNGYMGLYMQSDQYTQIELTLPWENTVRPIELHASNQYRAEFLFYITDATRATAKAATLYSSRPVAVTMTRIRGINFGRPVYAAQPLTDQSTEFYLASYAPSDLYTSDPSKLFSRFTILNGPNSNTVKVVKPGDPDIEVIPETQLAPLEAIHWIANDDIPDVTGMHVTAELPVSAYTNHFTLYVPSWTQDTAQFSGLWEQIYHQMPAVADAGKKVVAGPIMGRQNFTGYTLRIVILNIATIVDITYNGDVAIVTDYGVGSQCSLMTKHGNGYKLSCNPQLHPGDFIELRMSNALEPAFINCHKKCNVWQYNHGFRTEFGVSADWDNIMYKSDPYQVLLPSVKQQAADGITYFHTNGIYFSIQQFHHFVTVVVPCGTTFTYDGKTLSEIPDRFVRQVEDWHTHSFPIEAGFHQIEVEAGVASVVYVYGHGSPVATAYGFSPNIRV